MTLIQLLGCFSSQKLLKRELANAESLKPIDAVIVPGISFKNGAWDSIMKARVIWSYILYKEGIVKNIIFSGAPVRTQWYESKIMALYAEKIGIPAANIFCETKARHSTENVYYSYLLARQLGFKSIGLATDPVQSSLLKSFTRKRFSTPVYHIPFIMDTIKQYNHVNPVIDPSSAKKDNFISITRTESFWRRLKGTLGRDIDWSRHPNGRVEGL